MPTNTNAMCTSKTTITQSTTESFRYVFPSLCLHGLQLAKLVLCCCGCCRGNQESISSNITTPLLTHTHTNTYKRRYEGRVWRCSNNLFNFRVCPLLLFVIAAACCAVIMFPQVIAILLSFLFLFDKYNYVRVCVCVGYRLPFGTLFFRLCVRWVLFLLTTTHIASKWRICSSKKVTTKQQQALNISCQSKWATASRVDT